MMVFISAFGMYLVPDLMGGARSMMIGNLIQNQFLQARNWPFGAAIALTLTARGAGGGAAGAAGRAAGRREVKQ